MKQLIIILIANIIVCTTCFAQTFTLQDSTFEIGATLTTYEVKFEYDKPILKQESMNFLDQVVLFLQKNPNLNIEIGYHGDLRGNYEYSLCITSKRAQSIMYYLLDHGIPSAQLAAKGYKNIEPIIIDPQTIEERKLNQRTEFTILQTN